ncbi:MAG: M1 family aminopeptidase [Terriglobia bacterium]
MLKNTAERTRALAPCVATWSQRRGSLQRLPAALAALFCMCFLAPRARAQAPDASQQFKVTHYTIDATLYPSTHMLVAKAQISLTPGANMSTLSFRLDSALKVKSASGPGSQAIQYSQQGLALTLTPGSPLPAGQPATVTVDYGGELTSTDGSPVEGLKLAYVGPEGSYLLYPSCWFPVRADGLDRFSATMHITVPQGETVIASGNSSGPMSAAGGTTYTFIYDQNSFPGTVIAGNYIAHPAAAAGVNITLYLKQSETGYAAAYGTEAEKVLAYYASHFDVLPTHRLALVEIDNGAVGGYSAPGVVALAARGFTDPPDVQLLAHEISHQWWRCLVSPATPDDAFLDEGLATYSAALFIQDSEGETAFENQMHQISIGALTHESAAPIAQASQLHPFSPEYESVVFDKGAMVFHMLRWVMGNQAFFNTLKSLAHQYAWQPVSTADFQKLAEASGKQSLTYFFAQWVDSTGVPQFKRQWAVYRTQHGYQVVGKMQQDLDIFRMPVDIRVYVQGSRPVNQRIEMVGTTADFTVNTPRRPLRVVIDPASDILKYTPETKIQVEMARGDQLAQAEEYFAAIDQYRKVLQDNPNNSLAHYRIGDVLFTLHNYNASLEEFQDSLNGDLQPRWVEVWSYLKIGEIFDVIGQRDRALNEYERALHTNDNTQGALDLANRYLQKPYTQQRNQLGG